MKGIKGIICRVLAVIIALTGMVYSAVAEHDFVMCLGFLGGGFIAYELAIIISKLHK